MKTQTTYETMLDTGKIPGDSFDDRERELLRIIIENGWHRPQYDIWRERETGEQEPLRQGWETRQEAENELPALSKVFLGKLYVVEAGHAA